MPKFEIDNPTLGVSANIDLKQGQITKRINLKTPVDRIIPGNADAVYEYESKSRIVFVRDKVIMASSNFTLLQKESLASWYVRNLFVEF